MSRIFVTALSALSVLFLGIVALQYQAEELSGANLTNNSAEAYNLTTNVSSDIMTISGNAMPILLGVVIVVLAFMVLLVNR